MDILRVLSAPDLEVRKKTLNIALDLVTSRNIEEVLNYMSIYSCNPLPVHLALQPITYSVFLTLNHMAEDQPLTRRTPHQPARQLLILHHHPAFFSHIVPCPEPSSLQIVASLQHSSPSIFCSIFLRSQQVKFFAHCREMRKIHQNLNYQSILGSNTWKCQQRRVLRSPRSRIQYIRSLQQRVAMNTRRKIQETKLNLLTFQKKRRKMEGDEC